MVSNLRVLFRSLVCAAHVHTCVNFIRAASLQHHLYKTLLENPKDPDLILHIEVGLILQWQSSYKIYKFNWRNKKLSLYQKSKFCWSNGLSLASGFITDIMEKLNYLNLELQRKDKHIAIMIESVNSFKTKLVLWISHLQMKSLCISQIWKKW